MKLHRSVLLFLSAALLSSAADTTSHEQYGTGDNLFLNLYQNYISPIKGGNTCPMYPSCSQYAKLTFSKDNPALAFVHTCDRLVRCGHDNPSYIHHPQLNRLYDPVEDSLVIACRAAKEKIELVNSPKQEKSLEDLLLSFSEYDLALAKCYEKLLTTNDSTLIAELLQNIGRIYLLKEDYSSFVRFYQKASGLYHLSSASQIYLDLQLASCYYNQGQYRRSVSVLKSIDSETLPDQLRDEAFFMQMLSHARLFQWDSARTCAEKVRDGSPYKKGAEKLMALDKRAFKGQLKSPGLAATLSAIVPGTGYAYTGNYQTALASLLVNGLFIWASAESISKKNYAIGACATFLASGFYFGNIKGSYRSAAKRNREIKNEAIDKIIMTEED